MPTCQEVVLERGTCFVEIEAGHHRPIGPCYVARISVLERGQGVRRPLVFPDGRAVEVHAATETLALNSAIGLLEQHFGAPTLPDRGCPVDLVPVGPPLVLEDPPHPPQP